MNFTIIEEYCTDLVIRTPIVDPDPEKELMNRLKYGESYSVRSEDHPEFTKLREQLGKEGYITIERGWWNGDRVVKPFTLNNKKFRKGDKFPCAAAIHWDLFKK
jgi:hypothetical protein